MGLVIGLPRMTALAKVDSKGRITIPQPIRDALEIETGMYVVLLADLDRREILVSPVAGKSGDIYEFEIEFKDEPGALANAAAVFAKYKADIIASRCASIMRGTTAGCTFIVDFRHAEKSPEEISKELESLPVTTIVKFKRFDSY
jgi:AbrB family looped-hinge helix DNA binding protein